MQLKGKYTYTEGKRLKILKLIARVGVKTATWKCPLSAPHSEVLLQDRASDRQRLSPEWLSCTQYVWTLDWDQWAEWWQTSTLGWMTPCGLWTGRNREHSSFKKDCCFWFPDWTLRPWIRLDWLALSDVFPNETPSPDSCSPWPQAPGKFFG